MLESPSTFEEGAGSMTRWPVRGSNHGPLILPAFLPPLAFKTKALGGIKLRVLLLEDC